MKTPVIGTGNPVFVDDGVGVRVAQEVATLVDDEIVVVEDASTNSFAVPEMTTGHEKVVKVIIKMSERVVEDFGQK